MNIGVDVDGVLTDMGNYQLKWGKKYFEKKLDMTIKNPKAYDVEDIYGCTHEQREAFWTKYIWRYCLCEPITEDAAETAEKLRQMGHKIIIITGRAHTTERGLKGLVFREMLKYWLKKNRFSYDELLFCSEKKSSAEKYEICLEKNIDIMIEDKPENIFLLKNKIKVLCYPALWNQDIREFDHIRIKKFSDILNMV